MSEVLRQKSPAVCPFILKILREHYRDLQKGQPQFKPRRFPPPWSIEEHNQVCFIVRDKNGQALAVFLFRG
jgi:hypothetical protein